MKSREKIMTTLVLTTLLFCVVKETDAVNNSLYISNIKNQKRNSNQVDLPNDHLEVPHEHLPEEDVIYTTIKKQHQLSSLVK